MADVDREALGRRISKIEGQLRGIKAMIEQDRECEDIIIQLSAASSAITNTARVILEGHIEQCVVEGIQRGDAEETVKDLKRVVEQFAKMK